jgi:tetratricopeptide (TPR) repeat protein
VPVDAHAEWAAGLARQLIATGNPPPGDLDDAQRLALAWALKDCAIAAWSSEPSQVKKASDALEAIRSAVGENSTAQTNNEIHAVSEWVVAIADIVRGSASEALAHICASTAAFDSAGDHLHAAQSLVTRVMLLSVLGHHEDAIETAMRALDSLLILGDLHSAGKVRLNLGTLHSQRQNHAEALHQYEGANQLFRQINDTHLLAVSEIGIADAQASFGDFRSALVMYQQANLHAKERKLTAR